MASRLKQLLGDEKGNALLEFTVVMPVLMTLGFGAFEFSNAFFDHQEVSTGIRDAARYLARIEPTPAAPTCDQAITANKAAAQNLAVFGNINGTGNRRVPGWAAGDVVITVRQVANAGYRGPNPLCLVTASTSFPYQSLGFLAAIGLPAPQMNASHTERWIGG